MKRWLLVSALLMMPLHTEAASYKDTSTTRYSPPTSYNMQAQTMQQTLTQALQKRQTTVTYTYYGKLGNVRGHLRDAVEAALRTDEYLAYDYRGYSAEWRGRDGNVQVTLYLRYSQTATQAAYVTQEVKKRLPSIIAGAPDAHAKVKAIHDYVVRTLTYDTSLNQAINSPYYALTTGKTLCNGYAMLTYQLLKEAGIPVRLISGKADGIGHVWNLVQLDGQWYHLDTTWDDPLPDKGQVSYDYYLLSDAMIAPDHHFTQGGLNAHDAPYPKAVSNYQEVLLKQGRISFAQSVAIATASVATPQALQREVEAQLARFEPHITVTYNGQASDVAPALQRALASASVASAPRYGITEQPRTRGQQTVSLEVAYTDTLRELLLTTPPLTAGDSPRYAVTALMTNGQQFDVTHDAFVTSQSPHTTVQDGRLLVKGAGDAMLQAQFRGATTPITVTVAPLKKRLYYPLKGIASQGTYYNVPNTAAYDFTFTEAVAHANIYAMTAYGEAVPVATSIEGTRVTIAPAATYPSGTLYLVAADVTSVNGNALAAQSYRITIQ